MHTYRGTAFLAALSLLIAACGPQPAARAQEQTGSNLVDPAALRERLNADAEFQLMARYWDTRLRLEVGNSSYDVKVSNGSIIQFAEAVAGSQYDLKVAGPVSAWTDRTVSMGMLRGANGGRGERKLVVEGDRVAHGAPYQAAVLRLVRVMGDQMGVRAEQPDVADVNRAFDTVVGRYVYVRVRGTQYRVYYEEAGRGSIPLFLQHTAGADSRQWRDVLEDADIQKNFRIIAYDMPFHGKSVPPTGKEWWTQEYRLTTDLFMETVLAVSKALELERPVYLGCSIGGYLAPDLAYYHPNEFRAVIGLNAAIAGSAVLAKQNGTATAEDAQAGQNTSFHPRVGSGAVGASNYMNTSPIAPEARRRETAWVYSQGAPGVFAGDSYYYGTDHDLTGGKAEKIDTSKVEVHLLSGEYDRTAQPGPGSGQALANAIKGSTFQIIRGASHFVMSDDYPRLRQHLVPLLNAIHARHSRPTQTTSKR